MARKQLQMTLFTAEHRRLMQVFFPLAHEECSELLGSLGSFLEKRLLPLSPKLDAGEASIEGPRAELMAQGMCRIPFPEEYGGLGLPFGVYSTAVELLGGA
ncbi:MAG TPA: acyl-CoA dehydrogenase family protein, partial [Nitrososphaerales archaeon]|nr:acyl-CoA dehydrogenase family protein [Nitrososphaerales archaeon]